MHIRSRLEKLERRAGDNRNDGILWTNFPHFMTVEEWEAQLAEAEKHRAENYQNFQSEGADWMEHPKTIAEYEYAYMLRDEDQRNFHRGGHHASENETE